jgi:ribosomal subunit interface protein
VWEAFVDIVVKGRREEVPDRFWAHVTAKLGKLERIAPKVTRIDVELSRETNPRQSRRAERIELTCRARGPVIRAEAAADDAYAALDLACARLAERLRRAADRRRVHHGNRTPVSVAAATTPTDRDARTDQDAPPDHAALDGDATQSVSVDGEGPVIESAGPFVVREKIHDAEPMTLDAALHAMELVGHDFYLFVDADSRAPSVVYRRRGYDYGVIRLRV